MIKRTAIASAMLLAGTASADLTDVFITEVYAGISGEDGTSDWIEVTNFGTDAVSLVGTFYDDESGSVTDGDPIPDVTLAAGESIIVLVDVGGSTLADPVAVQAEIDNFITIWGDLGIQIVVSDGGGLNPDGDGAFVLAGDGTIIAGVGFGDVNSFGTSTLQFLPQGNTGGPFASEIGVLGAFESNAFFNDEPIGGVDQSVTLIGSPGVVPTPGAAAILGLGGLAAARRRR